MLLQIHNMTAMRRLFEYAQWCINTGHTSLLRDMFGIVEDVGVVGRAKEPVGAESENA